MRSILVVLLCFTLTSMLAGDQEAAPNFSRYGNGLLWESMEMETESSDWHLLWNSNVVVMSEFRRGGIVAVKWCVDDAGADKYVTFNILDMHSSNGHVSQPKLETLRAAIRGLPATNALPPIDDLLIVSFRQGTNRITRSYDKRAPSKSASQIHDLIELRGHELFTGRFTVN